LRLLQDACHQQAGPLTSLALVIDGGNHLFRAALAMGRRRETV
jgi:hypothetical protein